MDEVSAGGVEAFGQLYDRFCHRAYRLAYSVCRDEGRAEDAVQEAFLAVWRSGSSYRADRGTVAAWLLTMVRYRAIDLARRNGPLTGGGLELEERPGPDETDAAVIARDTAARLRACLATLPDGQQEVITLAYFGGLTHAEIASCLRLPPGTVKGRMRLGLRKLRASIDRAVV